MAANTDLISAANNAFGLNLFKVIPESGGEQNVFLSPFSLSTALAMTHLGARNKTATDMAGVLQWDIQDQSKIHEQYKSYITLLQTPAEEFQLSTANRIYIENNFPVAAEFKGKTQSHYFAEPVNADFKHNADGERVKINTWVEEQTQSKIKDLLTQGVLNNDTRMVLVNAIYFKGKWDNQFKERDTMPMTFKMGPGKDKKVPMMNNTGMYAIVADPELKCKALEILYKGKNLGMVIILPDEDFGLKELVDKLTPEKLNGLLKKLGPNSRDQVQLSLPRFEVTSSFHMRSPLSNMGMSVAFDEDTADFSGMTGRRDLFLHDAHHKAFVKVDEEGTKAAAVTTFEPYCCCSFSASGWLTFRVDHPFLFVIRDKRAEGTALFFGQIADPEE